MLKILKQEAYRAHFLVGAGLAVVGVLLWVLFHLGMIAVYPIKTHSLIMIHGFLISFVSGFLMTAIPRMTSTKSASVAEKSSQLANTILVVVVGLAGATQLSLILSLGQFAQLAIFFIRRKRVMRGALPVGFQFIPAGILCGFLGITLILLGENGIVQASSFGRLLLYEGFILNLIIGLGSRLVPVLTKKNMSLSPAQTNMIPQSLFWLEVILFNFSFFIEAFFSVQWGIFCRAAVFTVILFVNFKFHRKSLERTNLGMGIGASAFLMATAYWLILFLPPYRNHLIHILYIGGFALLTFLISIRVSLAHGGASLVIEQTSRKVLAIFYIFFLAALVRALGPLYRPDLLVSQVALAACVFISAIVFWFLLVGKYLLGGKE